MSDSDSDSSASVVLELSDLEDTPKKSKKSIRTPPTKKSQLDSDDSDSSEDDKKRNKSKHKKKNSKSSKKSSKHSSSERKSKSKKERTEKPSNSNEKTETKEIDTKTDTKKDINKETNTKATSSKESPSKKNLRSSDSTSSSSSSEEEQENDKVEPEASAPHQHSAQATKKGYLEKKGNLTKKWYRRCFVLQNGTLYYFENNTDLTPKGVIGLVNAHVYPHVRRASSPSELGTYFNIRANNRDYLLRAPSEELKNEWVDAIRTNVVFVEQPSEQTAQQGTQSKGGILGKIVSTNSSKNPNYIGHVETKK